MLLGQLLQTLTDAPDTMLQAPLNVIELCCDSIRAIF